MMELNKAFEGHWLSRVDEYRHTPRVNFGVGAAARVGELAKQLAKNKNCLIITDKFLSKAGIIDGVRESLEKEGFKIDIYESEVKEPDASLVEKLIDNVKNKNYGMIVGVGGGAVMDNTKIAAVMSETSGKLNDYVCPSTKPLTGSKPKILIPTTSGTGSECSNTAVVIVPGDIGPIKTWITGDAVLADAAVIDPTLMLGLPPRVTAGSGMDALSHTAEAVLSLQANPFSDALSLKAVELVSQNLRTAYQQGSNLEARWNMALAASIGGTVISYPWVAGPATLGHVASEGISAKYGIPHGEACGVLLPYIFWYNLPDPYARKKMSKIAEAMGEDVFGMTDKEASESAITAIFDLLEDLDLPVNLKDYKIPEKDLPTISEYIVKRAEEMYAMSKFNPRKANLENIKEFFRKAYAGREAIGF